MSKTRGSGRRPAQCTARPEMERSYKTAPSDRRLYPIERVFYVSGRTLAELNALSPIRLQRVKNAKKKRDKIAIIHEIFYLWRMMRLSLLLPVTFTDTGYISFSWKSWATRVTVAMWLVLVPYAGVVMFYVAVKEIEKFRVKPHNLQEFSQLLAVTVTTIFDIFIPFPVFSSMRAFTKLTASWHRMEARYEMLTGSPPHLGVKPFIYTAFVVAQLFAIVLLVALHDQLGFKFWMMVPLTHAVLCCITVVMVWVSGYVAVAVLAFTLARRIISDCESQGVAGLRLHRLLWRHITKLLMMFHACWSGVQVSYIFFMFIICTVYFFNFVHTFFMSWEELVQCVYATVTSFSCREISLIRRTSQNALVYIAAGGGLLLICLSAQIATESVNCARQSVLRLPISGKSRVYQYEVFSFLEEIRGMSLSLTLNRFVDIGRPRIITMIVMALTYCVVLSQFSFLDK